MSIMTIHQLERISGMVEQIIAAASPRNPKVRRLVVRLASLDQSIARMKREGKTI